MPPLRGDLEVAWSEACTNVVLHAYGSRNESFAARAALDPGSITLTSPTMANGASHARGVVVADSP